MTVPGLIATVHEFEGLLDHVGLRRSYGGAIAYNYYGPERFTHDVDVLVLIPDLKAPALVEELRKHGAVRSEQDSLPVELRPMLDDWRSKAHLTAFVLGGVIVEVFVPWHPFHHRVLDRSPEVELGDRRIRIHSPEDLIVFKKIFDRPKDITDIRAILLAQKGKLDTARVLADAKELLGDESWKELGEIIEETL